MQGSEFKVCQMIKRWMRHSAVAETIAIKVAEVKPLEKELTEDEGFVVSEADETDEPEQQVMVAGATADPVKDYLKQIGKVPLLNAEQEEIGRAHV